MEPKRYLVEWTEMHSAEVEAEDEVEAEELARELDSPDTIDDVEVHVTEIGE